VKFNLVLIMLFLAGCGPADAPGDAQDQRPEFRKTGSLESGKLDEASGLQAGKDGVFFLHNDDGNRIFAIDASGRDLGDMKVDGATNRDWEDMTRVIGADGPLLVIGDTGDNLLGRDEVRLYFIREPEPGEYDGKAELVHRLDLRYPDGPHDVESIAYDSSSEMILLLTKRDQPPRLYGVPLDLAMWEAEAEAVFLAEVPVFRPPTRKDIALNPKRGLWVSQPTGMDITPDGTTAAVITYRSLYLFHRQNGESWAQAFQRTPIEVVGPPGSYEEAVAFGPIPGTVFVTTERRPAPIYRLDYERPVSPPSKP